MMKTAYPIEQSGSNSSGEDSGSRGAVKDRIGLLRGTVPRHVEGRVSLPVVKDKDADGHSGRKPIAMSSGMPFVVGFMLWCLRWRSGPS